nr:hypothetical protein [Streptomyces sp. V4I23]
MGVAVAVEKFGQVGFEGCGATGLEADDGYPDACGRRQRSDGALRDAAGNAELPGGDPRQSAALCAVGDLNAEARVFQHGHSGLEDLEGEVVVEGVDPEHDRSAVSVTVGGAGAEPGQEGLFGELWYVPLRGDAAQAFDQRGDAGCGQRVGEAGRAGGHT